MKLELHPDAARNFNEIAHGLCLRLAPIPQDYGQTSETPFVPDISTMEINGKDIEGEVELGMVDYVGKEVAKFFRHGDRFIGLHEENFEGLLVLSQRMQRTGPLSTTVSIDFLKNAIFDWMRDRYKGATQTPMTEYVIGRCEREIGEQEIWIPIAMLHIQEEVSIGRITLRTITREMIDGWQQDAISRNPENKDKYQAFFGRERKELQGLAAATIKVYAEPHRAREIAFEEAEKAIALLRIFHPGNIAPEVRSYWAVLGTENLETRKHVLVRDSNILQINHRFVDRTPQFRLLNSSVLSLFRKAGLDILSDLLKRDQMTKFQETLVHALLRYSESVASRGLENKLVSIFVALEMALLKADDPRIQRVIAERMAIFLGTSLKERKAILRSVINGYGLRSKFIHHGYVIEKRDMEGLKEFLAYAWRFFHLLITNAYHFEDKQALIEAIEDAKLAGGLPKHSGGRC